MPRDTPALQIVLAALTNLSTDTQTEFYTKQVIRQPGVSVGAVTRHLPGLVDKGWLTMRQETQTERGKRPGRHRLYYKWTPEGLRESAKLLSQ